MFTGVTGNRVGNCPEVCWGPVGADSMPVSIFLLPTQAGAAPSQMLLGWAQDPGSWPHLAVWTQLAFPRPRLSQRKVLGAHSGLAPENSAQYPAGLWPRTVPSRQGQDNGGPNFAFKTVRRNLSFTWSCNSSLSGCLPPSHPLLPSPTMTSFLQGENHNFPHSWGMQHLHRGCNSC